VSAVLSGEDSPEENGKENQEQRKCCASPGLAEDEQLIEQFHTTVFSDADGRTYVSS
jgi:hypothetical protein